MRKKVAVLLAASALGVGGLTPGVAFGADDDTTSEEDDGSDYGWVGLLGLAGLAGLLGRKRDDHARVTPPGGTSRR